LFAAIAHNSVNNQQTERNKWQSGVKSTNHSARTWSFDPVELNFLSPAMVMAVKIVTIG